MPTKNKRRAAFRKRLTSDPPPPDAETRAKLEGMAPKASTPGVCRVCGCTDDDCSQCVEKTGEPCSWVEPDLCSACFDVAYDPQEHRQP